MATKLQLTKRIVAKVVSTRELTFDEFVAALSGLNTAERAQFAKALNSNRLDSVAQEVLNLRKSVLSKIGARMAAEILADDMVSLSEIDYLL